MGRIYFDHNATTAPYPEVLEEYARVATADWGNPSSLHTEGRTARMRLDEARERVARVLGVRAVEVHFTSGATEANHLALHGVRPASLAVAATEHPSVLETARQIERSGVALTVLPVDSDGRVRLEEVRRAIEGRPSIVSVMAANNETGTLQPIDEIAALCREHQVLFHTDATQILGRVPFSLVRSGIDLVSASGHKIHGPRGVGILVRRDRVRLEPVLVGGHQEGGFRAGTENVAAACAFARALEVVTEDLDARAARMREIRDRLATGLQALDRNVAPNADLAGCLPNTLNVRFPGISAETLLLALDLDGIAASSGSACSSGSVEPSPVLLAMGHTRRDALSSLRLSVAETNSVEEADRAVAVFDRVLARLAPRRGVRR